jgi:PAS domain S-box-containing protein
MDYTIFESREMLQCVIDNIPQYVFWKDRNLNYLGANTVFARSAGLREPAEIIGKSDFDLSWKESAEAYRADDRAVIESGVPKLNCEEAQKRPDGSVLWLRTSKVPLADNAGKIMGMLGIYEDITEQKGLKAQFLQSQKMEAVGQLAGGVAHDYNNILTSTLLQLSLLLNDPSLSEGTRSSLRQLENEAKRAAGLTRQLLMFSRQQVIQMKPLNLDAMLANLVKMLQRLLSKDVSLEFQAGDAPLWIEADPGMIEQVVTNLCVNAQDAMAPKGGRLTIDARLVKLDAEASRVNPDAYPGSFVCLSVADTGCGMDTETLKHLFEPFFTTKEVGKGTGLGLATVYGITKQHRGWVEVASQMGKGSTFRIYLPALTRAPLVRPESRPPCRSRGERRRFCWWTMIQLFVI